MLGTHSFTTGHGSECNLVQELDKCHYHQDLLALKFQAFKIYFSRHVYHHTSG